MKMKFLLLSLLFLLVGSALRAQTINFTMNKQNGCVPLSAVTFTDISTGGGGIISRDWDLGNGEIILNGPITVGTNYLTAQKYYVKLTVRFANNTSLQKIDSIEVYPKPMANFSASDTAVCISKPVTFTSNATTATGTLTNYQWDFGSGSINGTNASPTFTYNVAGNYQVSLIVRNNWGCNSDAATKPNYIHVYSVPVAGFSATPTFSCKDTLTVRFNNTTTGGGPTNQFKWHFGDGDSSTLRSPSHFYAAPGVYEVRLLVSIGGACSNAYVTPYYYKIHVGKPMPQFVTAPDTVCLNTPVNFVGRNSQQIAGGSTGYYGYSYWRFEDAGVNRYYENVNYTFTTPGNHIVRLIGYNYFGCADTISKTVHVRDIRPNFVADKLNGCNVPFTVTFTNTTLGNNLRFTWNFGDGTTRVTNGPQTVTHTYTYFTYFTVSLTAVDTTLSGSCASVESKTYYIKVIRPNINFTYAPVRGCKPLPVRFIVQLSSLIVPLTHYEWNFGDGTIVTTTSDTTYHTYTTAGVFDVTVKLVTPECMYTSVVKKVTVTAICDDDGGGGGGAGGGGIFMTARNCTNKYTITFTDTIKNNTIVTSWRFGDGNAIYTGPLLNPVTYTFTPPVKEYIVTVFRLDTITNIQDSAKKRVIIIDEKANFVPTSSPTICPNRYVYFTPTGIDSTKINIYEWDYGDGKPRDIYNNQTYYNTYNSYLNGQTYHYYTDTGVFRVKLWITDKNGCRDSAFFDAVVVRGPKADFVANKLSVCGGNERVLFNDLSVQNGNVPITSWQWYFGQGSWYTSNRDTGAAHTYVSNSYVSYYTVYLTVTDSLGCTHSINKPSYFKQYVPKADFYSYDTLKCNSYNVALYNNGTFYNGSALWNFGDGTTSIGYHGYKTYPPIDSVYNIKLVVVDENNCKDSITKPAFIKFVKPKANFIIADTNGCAPITVRFTDSSNYARAWVWNFGDGGTGSTLQNPSGKIYGTPGLYNVKLTITGPNNCVHDTTKTIRIRGPIGNLQQLSTSGCKPLSIDMKVTGSNILNYAWAFGDGTPVVVSTADSVKNHVYVNAGKYLPNVILTSPEGCPFTLVAADTVYVDSLKVNFTQDRNTLCETGLVQFTGSAALPNFSNVTRWVWDFGDGVSDSTSNPINHLYTAVGNYDVKLRALSRYGCIDSFIKPLSVIVKDTPNVTFERPQLITTCALNTLEVFTKVFSTSNGYVHYAWDKRINSSAPWVSTGQSGVGSPILVNGLYEYTATYPTFIAAMSDSGNQYRLRVATTAAGTADECAPLNFSALNIKVIDCSIVLPIKWLGIQAKKVNQQHIITWRSSSSESQVWYILERSTDGQNFKAIHQKIQIHASASQEYAMQFADDVVDNRNTYYRIKAISISNGKTEYSDIVLLQNETKDRVHLLHNPINMSGIKLNAQVSQKQDITLVLLDASGKLIATQKQLIEQGSSTIKLLLPQDMANGIYLLNISGRTVNNTLRVVLQK